MRGERPGSRQAPEAGPVTPCKSTPRGGGEEAAGLTASMGSAHTAGRGEPGRVGARWLRVWKAEIEVSEKWCLLSPLAGVQVATFSMRLHAVYLLKVFVS
ncbi:unnamed protein product [Rangifer tarandus platyrhynchus]|uniref:Uncharacterized protein n=1 Tax=Rangifer tarandus platyrhynchus TaxID=3082113 RepID=A0AC59YCL3_RANTA